MYFRTKTSPSFAWTRNLLVLIVAAALMSGCGDNTDRTNNAVSNNGAGDAGNNGGTDVSVPEDCSTYQEAGGRVETAVTLDGCYDVTKDLFVIGDGHLTIMPGTILRFAQGTALEVTTGKLTAEGTAANGILMTGATETPGFWKGVALLDTSSTDNALAYTIIEHAGGDRVHHTVGNGTLQLGQGTRIAVNNSILRNGASFGLNAKESTILDGFTGNTLTGHASGAASIHANIIGAFDATNTYDGNDSNYLHVRGGKIITDQLISAIDVSYLVESHTESSDSTVEIEAGTTIVFAADTSFQIWNDARLKAVGTADAPITFNGKEASPGFWKGIMINDSNGLDNELDYVVLEDAGNGKIHHTSIDGGLQLAGSAQVAITNTTIRNSNTYGLAAKENVNIREFATNTLTENVKGAARVHPNHLGVFDSESSYTNNDEDFVFVYGGRIAKDVVVQPLEVPYFVESDNIVDSNESTIEIMAGATLTFGSNSGLEIWSDARLKAIGTASDKITFTADEPIPGYWQGVMYNSSNSGDNVLEHVLIDYAGGERLHHTVKIASLQIGGSDTSQVALNNVEIANGGSFGIAIDDDANVTCSDVTFTSNAKEDYNTEGLSCSP
jgi:hypothetical protein